jgi:hypothetical protein
MLAQAVIVKARAPNKVFRMGGKLPSPAAGLQFIFGDPGDTHNLPVRGGAAATWWSVRAAAAHRRSVALGEHGCFAGMRFFEARVSG